MTDIGDNGGVHLAESFSVGTWHPICRVPQSIQRLERADLSCCRSGRKCIESWCTSHRTVIRGRAEGFLQGASLSEIALYNLSALKFWVLRSPTINVLANCKELRLVLPQLCKCDMSSIRLCLERLVPPVIVELPNKTGIPKEGSRGC